MLSDKETIMVAADLAEIGGFIIGCLAFAIQIRKEHMSGQIPTSSSKWLVLFRLILAILLSGILFLLAALVVYWTAILLTAYTLDIPSTQPTPTQLATRAATLATLLGLGLGVLLREALLKRISDFVRREIREK